MNIFNIKYFERDKDGSYRQHVKYFNKQRQDMPRQFTLYNEENMKKVEFILERIEAVGGLERFRYVTKFIDLPESHIVVYLEKDLS